MFPQLLHLNMLLKITHKKSILLKKRCNFQGKKMQKPSESNELIREECFMLEKVNGGKDVPGFLSSLCWHKETPPGWGDCYHQEALGWDPASSSILISSSLTKMSGILRRTKLPKKSPIPAQPRGRCLTPCIGHFSLAAPGHTSNIATQVFPKPSHCFCSMFFIPSSKWICIIS